MIPDRFSILQAPLHDSSQITLSIYIHTKIIIIKCNIQVGLTVPEIIEQVYRQSFSTHFIAYLPPFWAQHLDEASIRTKNWCDTINNNSFYQE